MVDGLADGWDGFGSAELVASHARRAVGVGLGLGLREAKKKSTVAGCR